MSDQDQEHTVLASNEDLRQILARMHSTLTYGSTLVSVTLAICWAVLGIREDDSVPTMLPILTIASVLFAVIAWTMDEEVQSIGKPYRTKVR